MDVREIKRIQGKLTNREFAAALGVSVATVRAWRDGRRRVTVYMEKLILLWEKEKKNGN